MSGAQLRHEDVGGSNSVKTTEIDRAYNRLFRLAAFNLRRRILRFRISIQVEALGELAPDRTFGSTH
jgi:hypothetical protein